jgi:hypothetical protein
LRRFLIAALAVFSLAACGGEKGDGGPRVLAGTCGFPKKTIEVDTSALPDDFVFDGVEIANFEDKKKRLTAALNVPYGVQDALPRYRDASKKAGFEVIQEDNEGFEAELYLRKGPDLAQVQIRGSQCRDAVRVYVSIVRDAALGAG